jgi:acyl carrier protein
MNLNTIAESLQPDVISSFWTMLQECRSQADCNDDVLLKRQVECWYRQWNAMTGDNKAVSWSQSVANEAPAAVDYPQYPGRGEVPAYALEARRDIAKTVLLVVRAQLGLPETETVLLDHSFVTNLGADSLDAVELVMAIEDEFFIEINDEDAEQCLTVGDAIKLVSRLLGTPIEAEPNVSEIGQDLDEIADTLADAEPDE